MTQVLAGAALGFAQRGEDRAALVFEARAALQAGGWHEGMNLGGVVRAPLIVVVGIPSPRIHPTRQRSKRRPPATASPLPEWRGMRTNNSFERRRPRDGAR